MESGWFHDDDENLAELNITPLVDIALVLLIIFMITAPMLVQGASVDLPQTRPMSRLPSGNVFITIDPEGQIFLNDLEEPIGLAALEERLAGFASLGQSVFLQGDVNASYGRIMAVVDVIHAVDLPLNLVTTPVPPNQR